MLRTISLAVVLIGFAACQTLSLPTNSESTAIRTQGTLRSNDLGQLMFFQRTPHEPVASGMLFLAYQSEAPWGVFTPAPGIKTTQRPLPVDMLCSLSDESRAQTELIVKYPTSRHTLGRCLGTVTAFDVKQSMVFLNIGPAEGVRAGDRYQLVQSYRGLQMPENQHFCRVAPPNANSPHSVTCAVENHTLPGAGLWSPTYAIVTKPLVATGAPRTPAVATEPASAPPPPATPSAPVASAPPQRVDEVPTAHFRLVHPASAEKRSARMAARLWAADGIPAQQALELYQQGTWFAAIPAAETTDTRPVAYFRMTKIPAASATQVMLTEVCRVNQPHIQVTLQEGMELQANRGSTIFWGLGRCLAKAVSEQHNKRGQLTAVTLHIGAPKAEQSPRRGNYRFLLNQTQQEAWKLATNSVTCTVNKRQPVQTNDRLVLCTLAKPLPKEATLEDMHAVAVRPFVSKKFAKSL